jgi:hypothetical protein
MPLGSFSPAMLSSKSFPKVNSRRLCGRADSLELLMGARKNGPVIHLGMTMNNQLMVRITVKIII